MPEGHYTNQGPYRSEELLILAFWRFVACVRIQLCFSFLRPGYTNHSMLFNANFMHICAF